ncbi:hypothetical protein BN1221_01954 [Brenneria goodwinii]|uniref:Uncharacterized protein n=1 Tax=Brenneria goodwinii TaxID=1109412 RepID=A0A0G4JUB2_9GAMM|nr:hypothetical protein BN1221_01954 [Brenneria goodwinii]
MFYHQALQFYRQASRVIIYFRGVSCSAIAALRLLRLFKVENKIILHCALSIIVTFLRYLLRGHILVQWCAFLVHLNKWLYK